MFAILNLLLFIKKFNRSEMNLKIRNLILKGKPSSFFRIWIIHQNQKRSSPRDSDV